MDPSFSKANCNNTYIVRPNVTLIDSWGSSVFEGQGDHEIMKDIIGMIDFTYELMFMGWI